MDTVIMSYYHADNISNYMSHITNSEYKLYIYIFLELLATNVISKYRIIVTLVIIN